MNQTKAEKFRVVRGSIVDGHGAILYDAESISDLSRAAKIRLAQIYTKDTDADWEKAADILVAEGLLTL